MENKTIQKQDSKPYIGRVRGTLRGGAYLIVEGQAHDCFLPAGALHGAMDGDTVQARIIGTRYDGVQEAEVLSVETRARTQMVGTVRRGEVIPDERRLPALTLLYARGERHVPEETKVVAEITHFSDGRRPLLGRVVEVLGVAGEPGVDVMSVIRRCGIRECFPEPVQEAAARAPKQVEEQDCAGRLDLRDTVTFTIDGRDSKDFDDAVSVQRLANGNLSLGVHIADVTAYVRAGGALDREAQLRGTSVYFADRVIPMLPEELSNGICSLNEGADRLTLSCIMELNAGGDVVQSQIVESVIRSRHRLVYDDVSALLTWDGTRAEGGDYDAEQMAALQADHADVLEPLRLLQTLAGTLHEKRALRGSIDFDVPESALTLDASGHAVGLTRAARGVSNRIIEECMLLCNEVVAHTLHAARAPFLYRVHGAPDGDRLRELNVFLNTLGYGVRHAEAPTSADVRAALLAASGTPEEGLVGKLLLRAMQKARYDAECLGHFGLASKEYCHFTSPIRRYPDLFIHRVIKLWLSGRLSGERRERLDAQAKKLAVTTSEAEQAAMEAERAVESLKKCEYMRSRIGKRYRGVVSGVTQNGLYVELPNTAEGFVRLAAFEDDFYVAEPKQYRIVGRAHGRVIRLGDQLGVTVHGVNLELAAIDFTPQSQYHNQSIYNRSGSGAPDDFAKRAAGAARQNDERPSRKKTEKYAKKRGGNRHATRKGRQTARTKPKGKA